MILRIILGLVISTVSFFLFIAIGLTFFGFGLIGVFDEKSSMLQRFGMLLLSLGTPAAFLAGTVGGLIMIYRAFRQ